MDAPPKLDFTPAVGDHAFTPKQCALLALANRLGREHFAARAAQWDEEASFPFANYDDLRARPLGICVPGRGGLGAATPYMMVARRSAAYAASPPHLALQVCSTMDGRAGRGIRCR